MSRICVPCGTQLEAAWKFCPKCGTAIPDMEASHSGPVAPVPGEAVPVGEGTAPEAAPVTGAFSGLLFGLIAVPLLLIVGIMLCLTGLGAFLGVPMIVAAILAPLLGPLFGMGAAKGKFL